MEESKEQKAMYGFMQVAIYMLLVIEIFVFLMSLKNQKKYLI